MLTALLMQIALQENVYLSRWATGAKKLNPATHTKIQKSPMKKNKKRKAHAI